MTRSTVDTTHPPVSVPDAPAAAAAELLAAVRTALAGSYDVERLLGAGGMGSVFLGRDRTLDRPVAIKVIAPELAAAATIRERFLHEARTVARLRHPNVVAVYTAGEADGVLYFVMEYVPGESLRDRLTREGRFDDRRAVEVLRDLARALGAAHAQGVVHRDVKPENILLDRDTGRAMLTDFGVARAFAGGGDGRLTGTGFVLGSPKYMSPEQAAGERQLDGRSDVYSLGLVAYEMFAGEAAVTASSAASMLVKQLTEKPAPIETRNDHVPAAVAAVISRALEKEPDARFPTAEAMAEALDLSLTGETRAAPAVVGPARAGAPAAVRPAGGRRPLVVAAALVVLALAAVGGWLALGRRGVVPRGVDPRKSYLVVPFEVQSGDPQLAWLREGSASMLTLSLAQWRDLNVVDYERGLDLLRDLKLDGARRVGLEDARRLARRAGVWTVVLGQVGGTADSLVVTASLYAVESAQKLDDAQRAAPRAADPRAVFDALARDLLDLAGAPSSVGVARLAETTTSSVEAYRDYLEGTRALNAWDIGRADSLLAEATRKDSTFALAYYRRALAIGWKNSGDTAQATAVARARRYAARLPERERALLVAYADLTTALRAIGGGAPDTAASNAAFLDAQRKYQAIIARDSGDAEAWYGLGDAYYHHRPDGFGGPRTLANLNRALRAFNRTLALDSTFHLAYSHKLDLYQQASQPQSWIVLDGDSVRVFRDSTERRAYGDARFAEAKRRAQTLAVGEARAWASADPAPTSYLALGRAYLASRRFDSAAAALKEGMDRLGARSGTLPFMRALALTRVDPVAAAEAMRQAVRTGDARAIAAQGGSGLFPMLVAASGVAGLGGNAGAVDSTIELAMSQLTYNTPPPVDPKLIFGWLGASVKVAMGVPVAAVRQQLDAGIAFADRRTDGGGMRAQNWPTPYVLFLATRDPRYAATVRRWRGEKAPPLDELDALEALAAGDTARARASVARFPSPDSLRAVNAAVSPMRWVARAEVFTELGDPRRAAAMYEMIEPSRLSSDLTTSADPGLALLARSYLARGRVYEQLGERERAAAAYERFVALWKEADPGLQPQVREARAGLARVRDAGKGQPVR
jgi:serine/threonine-protein kinase